MFSSDLLFPVPFVCCYLVIKHGIMLIGRGQIDDKGLNYELRMEQIKPEEISFNGFSFPSSQLSLEFYQTMVLEDRFIQPEIIEANI
jgi:hypothetical protein